jgi:energy-coupling factor transporter ATP-binding protein EcfA2
MATILGLTGAIGSGKTTLAQLLGELEPQHALYESGQLVAELANAFNQALLAELSFELPVPDAELVNQTLIWFVEAINEQLHREVTWNQLALSRHRLATHPEQYEKLFIYLQQVKAGPKLAKQPITTKNKEEYRPLLQWLGGYLALTISDDIWLDEIFRRIGLHEVNTRLIIVDGLRFPSDARIVREHSGLIVAIDRPGVVADNSDITEVKRADIIPDTVITNNGSLEQLREAAERLWLDASVSQLAGHYRAISP